MPILTHKCPHCLTEHIAHQVVAITEIEEWEAGAHIRCPKCRKPSCAQIKANPAVQRTLRQRELMAHPGDLADYKWQVIEFWPDPPAPEVPELIPPDVERIYMQAEKNFPIEGNEEAAGMMYRKALDIALKKIDPALTGTLFVRIKKLKEDGKLTEAIATWSDNIRDLGNDAAHEEKPITRDELIALRSFSEMVLRYLFSLPNMVKKRKGERLEWEMAEPPPPSS